VDDADGRVAVVSGANRGIGLEIVRQLAGKGFRVALGSRSVERGEEARDGLGEVASRVAVGQLDVSDPASIAAFTTWLHRTYRRCDVVVNNAAVMTDMAQEASTADLPVVRSVLDTNLIGAWMFTRAMVPAMRQRRYGRVVNMSSGIARFRVLGPGAPVYRVSKTALNALTRILAEELRADGILVNACCPGWVQTDLGGPGATVTVTEAADTPVWLATLPEDGPTSGFYRNRRPLEW
jgi:NAD(P)-dependent dehydrogenase (short-subunit alcohol dehydrogenase family)